ncbi:nucleoside deaminase, partial [Halobacteriales archaeon QS_9_70_65]
MEELTGTILAGETFEPVRGRVVVADGRVRAVEEATTESADIVLPAFVNAHTHLGDSVAKEAAAGLGLEEAVAPPDSLKHRRLAAADRSTLVTAMRRTLRFVRRTGTVSCLD